MKLKQTLSLNQQSIRVYAAENPSADAPLVLTFLQPHEADALAALLEQDLVLLAIDEADWEQSFTPWPAPKVFKKGADFSGDAGAYFARLCAMLPAIESSLNLQPRWRGIAGYSLAGLFAAWSAYQNGQPFSRTACVSGSMWYDGWPEFSAQAMPSPPQYAYFSLGDEEKNSKNPRMAAVEDNMRATEALWHERGIRSTFETNSGGHFHQVPERIAAAIAWLAQVA